MSRSEAILISVLDASLEQCLVFDIVQGLWTGSDILGLLLLVHVTSACVGLVVKDMLPNDLPRSNRRGVWNRKDETIVCLNPAGPPRAPPCTTIRGGTVMYLRSGPHENTRKMTVTVMVYRCSRKGLLATGGQSSSTSNRNYCEVWYIRRHSSTARAFNLPANRVERYHIA